MDVPQSNSNASQTSASELPSSGFSSVEPEPLDPFAQSAKDLTQQPFKTLQSFRKALERRHQELLNNQTRDHWGPVSTNAGPSFVVEVGLSKSAQHLALATHGWLETPSSSVHLAITINIARENPEIVLHRWELTPRRYGVRTRSSPPSACRTASIRVSRTNNATSVAGEIYVNGTATSTRQLDLPFAKITGRNPQQPLERDLMISEQALQNFAEGIWRRQGLL
ncbi:hypothetical protein PMG11_09048 [Penicillium brasilianum]|uniref:Uncharacterized protein n=1 Tax=Penicillium brasilianum TaxID=104259 RepID=A0A0F7TYM4_PENBI|nr:hypothetical protein PMG11_09048 [Penicillium brasilianum]